MEAYSSMHTMIWWTEAELDFEYRLTRREGHVGLSEYSASRVCRPVFIGLKPNNW